MHITVDHAEVLRLTQDLVSIESHIEADGREALVGRFLADWFEERGVAAELQPVDGPRANLVARVPGSGGPALLLNGHLDTVPAGAMEHAFTPTMRDGELWGRGTCDMKGAIAAMACVLAAASEAVRSDRGTLSGDLIFAGTVGEETGSIGVKALVAEGLQARWAVVGEPTSLRVAVAHKGACFLRVVLHGRGAHGSCPEKGVNAASYAARIVEAIEDTLRPRLAERTYPLLGPSTVNVGRICGGTQPNIVAESCEIDIDRRTLPGEPDPVGEVRAIVERICGGVAGLSFDVFETEETAIVPHVPLGTAPEAPLAIACFSASRNLEMSGEPIGVTYWTDGGHLAAHGVETIILGPGDIAHAHGPNERVKLEELGRAADLYAGIAVRMLCATEPA